MVGAGMGLRVFGFSRGFVGLDIDVPWERIGAGSRLGLRCFGTALGGRRGWLFRSFRCGVGLLRHWRNLLTRHDTEDEELDYEGREYPCSGSQVLGLVLVDLSIAWNLFSVGAYQLLIG